MKRQRGFVMLIVYAVMAVAALGALYALKNAVYDHIGKPYAEAQRLADQKVVDRAGVAQAAAERDTKTALGREDACKDALGIAKEGKKAAEDKAKANLAESAKAKAQTVREREAATPYIARLEADAAAKGSRVLTCEESLTKADKTLTEALCRARPGQPGCK